MKCAVTGARGYVGSVITNYLRRYGLEVYELRSDVPQRSDRFKIPYSLEKRMNPALLRSIDVLIHCAYDFRLTSWNEIYRVNVLGARRLFEDARNSHVKKIIFISTMSAFPLCKSLYGKAKMEIEADAERFDLTIVRPGLVFGPSPGGMMGTLLQVIMKHRVVPLIDGGEQLFYLCHEDDLARLICQLSLIQNDRRRQPLNAASPVGLPLKQILTILAAYKKRKIFFLPVSKHIAHLGLKAAEFFCIPIPFRSDNLTSLLNQNPVPDFSATRRLGVIFRDFSLQSLVSSVSHDP